MHDRELIRDSYFLTRQTANLMEDFVQEINQSSSFFLLYAQTAVGKSRFLNELVSKRLSEYKVHWIDFKNHSLAENNEAQADPSQSMAELIAQLIEQADKGDIIIADHFQLASNKARHQLLQSWCTDGADKKLNIIVTLATQNPDEIRHLARQHQVSIRSFQLMPFTPDEVGAFLAAYLFPDSPLSRLSIPKDLKKKLKDAGGKVGKVIELANQRRAQIRQSPVSDSEGQGKAFVAIGSLAILLLIVFVILAYATTWHADKPSLKASDKPISLFPASPKKHNDEQPNSVTGLRFSSEPPSMPAEQLSEPIDTENKNQVPPQSVTVDSSHIDNEIDNESNELTSNPAETVAITDNTTQNSTWFQQQLDSSLEWIQSNLRKLATIQIMSIGFKQFTDDAYRNYLDKLAANDVEVTKIRIFRTTVGNAIVYSVIYDEYTDRREASRHIKLLPGILRANQPIPRTIGSIVTEMHDISAL